MAAPGDAKPLAREESRWVITPGAAYFYGDESHPLRRGAQFAVYSFLESQLGIRWIEPGDRGIAYRNQSPLELTAGKSQWIPKLVFSKIRQGFRKGQAPRPRKFPLTDEFLQSAEEFDQLVDDAVLWQKRMRMGGSRPGGGHAFSTWWDKYGKTHPDYFALNKFGKREPVKHRKPHYTNAFVKICPSNPKVAEQLIQDWLPRKTLTQYISSGPNDGYNFCRCKKCMALDAPREGETFPGHLTDRYLHLANAVAREARKHNPDAWVTMYGYLTTLHPPRKIKAEPNVLVQLVPYVIPLDTTVTADLFSGWREAGVKKMAFRPNYHTKYHTATMPMGFEKQMFDVFQIAFENGAVSADYDSLTHNWPVIGMADYILAKAMSDPSKPFEYWEDHYCSAYGPASEDVKRYFRYWRQEVWEQRLRPRIQTILDRGGVGNFVRGLMWSLGDYYKPADFDRTDALLQQAQRKKLVTRESESLNQLVLANRHARLVYNAVAPKGPEKHKHSLELLAFRRKHKDELRFPWVHVFGMEKTWGDIAGIELAQTMGKYLLPWLAMDQVWRFKLDPEDAGLRQKWPERAWEQTADWERIRTDEFWENQDDEDKLLSPATRAKLKKYDGIAWYTLRYAVPEELRGRRVFLRFGAVDESCWIYVNGKLSGKHVFKKADDWKTPFEIRVDSHLDWSKKHQLITVRVEDKSGAGGIWRRVWIVSKE